MRHAIDVALLHPEFRQYALRGELNMVRSSGYHCIGGYACILHEKWNAYCDGQHKDMLTDFGAEF